MRYIGILLVLASIPAFIVLLRSQPEWRRYSYFAIGFFPFALSALNLDAALWNGSGFIGHTRGIILSLLDTLCIAILATSRSPFAKLPFIVPFSIYVLAVAVATIFATPLISSSFYLFQLIRIFLIFAAVASVVTERKALKFIALGLASGTIIELYYSVTQRVSGVFQVHGTMPHQNTLGMMLHFVTIPLIAMVLAGEKSKLIYAGIASGVVCVALSASRGSIGFLVLGVVILFALTLFRHSSPRKWKVIASAFGIFVLVSPIIYGGISQRLETLGKSESGYDERAAFERAATMMANDHFFGVGPNQYVRASNMDGYAAEAGVAWNHGSRSAHVHNLYLLQAAETGWLSMGALIIFFGATIFGGFAYAFRRRRDPSGEMVLGFTIALLTMAIHSLYEWISITYEVQTIIAVSLGIIAGLMRQRAQSRSTQQYSFDAETRKRMRSGDAGMILPPPSSAHQSTEDRSMILTGRVAHQSDEPKIDHSLPYGNRTV